MALGQHGRAAKVLLKLMEDKPSQDLDKRLVQVRPFLLFCTRNPPFLVGI